MEPTADAIVVGAGLAGLVAASELAAAGKHVLVLDQEPEASLGGQAFWSFGGLFLVNSPEQRAAGLEDSLELAWSDWQRSAQFDRPEDEHPQRFARSYVEFAAGEMREWIGQVGIQVLPNPWWARYDAGDKSPSGNSVPRFHLTGGFGPAVVQPFVARVRAAADRGLVRLAFRHRADALIVDAGQVVGVAGAVLEPSEVRRGAPSSREVVGEFSARAGAVLIASGGIGHNLELIRRHWPERLGPLPPDFVIGVPGHVDGRMLGIAGREVDAQWIGRDRMWHYAEGVRNWKPIWENHGIRILAAPSSVWLDADGRRLPVPRAPGQDTLGALTRANQSGRGHSWFVLNRQILANEFTLQNPDLAGQDVERVLSGPTTDMPPVLQGFLDNSPEFLVRDNLRDLVAAMNALTQQPLLDPDAVARELSSSTEILDPASGPLVAVQLHVLTRKTLGGLQTDLDAAVLDGSGRPVPGLYAAGEAAGFGGGGMHGYKALEGTFLGGCLFSGRVAGRAIATR